MDQKIINSLFEILIDARCDEYGVRTTIAWLFDQGLTREDILSLRFDEADVKAVEDNPDKIWAEEDECYLK